MSRTRTAPWDYQYNGRRTDAEDELLALYNLKRLEDLIGSRRYQAWCNSVLQDGDSWLAKERKARQAIDEEGWSVDEADLRQTQHDARPSL